MYSRANSSLPSSTCARVAPSASARSRTIGQLAPLPQVQVTAMISAPYRSASHGMAIEVSSPPEYAEDDSLH